MRFADCVALVCSLVFLTGGSAATEPMSAVHVERYCMGTMFDIVAYHVSKPEAERAAEKAMAEIERLDRVMSHFRADSDLSQLVRDGRTGFVKVDSSLYDVIARSIEFSKASNGRFDVTIAPVVKLWKAARADGRAPDAAAVSRARTCVGYRHIELGPPDRIRFHSDCLEIDLGAIGKGYAVDRAMEVLRSAGVQHASINAGGSSIAAIGRPPDRPGWQVNVGDGDSRRTLVLRDTSISTSQQNLIALALQAGESGDIVDPSTAAPVQSRMSVSVVAPTATASDALSTTLVLMSREEGKELLSRFPDVSAIWLSADGEPQGFYGESRLRFLASR